MAITAFRGMGSWAQLVFTAFVCIATLLIIGIFGLIIAIPIFGFNDLISASNTGNIEIFKYFQTLSSIALYVIPPVIVAYLFEGKVKEYLLLNGQFRTKTFLATALSVIIFMPFIGFIGEWNNQLHFPEYLTGLEEWVRTMEENTAVMIEKFIKVETLGGLLFNIFMIAVIPALGEEFLFRGVVQKIFTKITKNYHWGIWISAIIFSAIHLQFLGFIPRMLLGALFGYILVWSGSMWLPVIGHFLNNLIAVLALHAQNQSSEDISQLGEYAENMTVHWSVAILSLLLTVAFLIILKKESEKKLN